MLDGARRFDARHAAIALDRRGQGAALTADERARTLVDVDAEIEIAAKDVRSEKAHLLGASDGRFQAVHCQRILRAHIDIALVAADGETRDHHALEHTVWIALHHAAVHERAGIALVGVADEMLLLPFRLPGGVPLKPGGEARSAAAAQAGIENIAADLLVRHLEQCLFKRAVAALGDILLDVLGVRRAAVFQHHTVLLFIKRDILLLRVRRAVEMVDQTVDDLAAEYGLL